MALKQHTFSFRPMDRTMDRTKKYGPNFFGPDQIRADGPIIYGQDFRNSKKNLSPDSSLKSWVKSWLEFQDQCQDLFEKNF